MAATALSERALLNRLTTYPSKDPSAAAARDHGAAGGGGGLSVGCPRLPPSLPATAVAS